mgnify:CR=1 FL=1
MNKWKKVLMEETDEGIEEFAPIFTLHLHDWKNMNELMNLWMNEVTMAVEIVLMHPGAGRGSSLFKCFPETTTKMKLVY